MTHKTREAIDEQQKQMQSSMTAEELRQEIIKLGDNPDISWADYKDRLFVLINQFERDILIERDSIWMDSIAHCDILTNDNIAEIKRAVSWHNKINYTKTRITNKDENTETLMD